VTIDGAGVSGYVPHKGGGALRADHERLQGLRRPLLQERYFMFYAQHAAFEFSLHICMYAYLVSLVHGSAREEDRKAERAWRYRRPRATLPRVQIRQQQA
jgi:hypothetical protein